MATFIARIGSVALGCGLAAAFSASAQTTARPATPSAKGTAPAAAASAPAANTARAGTAKDTTKKRAGLVGGDDDLKDLEVERVRRK